MWSYHTGFEISIIDEDRFSETHYFETEELAIKGLILISNDNQKRFLSYNKYAQLCVCRSIKDACEFFEHVNESDDVDISINIYLENARKEYNCDFYVTNSLDDQIRIRRDILQKIKDNGIKNDERDNNQEKCDSSDDENYTNYRCNDYSLIKNGKIYRLHEIVKSKFCKEYSEMLQIKALINQPPQEWLIHIKELDNILLNGTPEKNKEIIDVFNTIIKRYN